MALVSEGCLEFNVLEFFGETSSKFKKIIQSLSTLMFLLD